jgi:hypothetical protein
MMLSPNRREGWVDPGTVGMPEMATATAIERHHNPSYCAFPNLIIPISPTGMPCVAVWPKTVRTSAMEVLWFAPSWGEGPRGSLWETRIANFARIVEEDIQFAAPMQETIESPGFRGVPLNYQERRIYHWNEEVDRRIGVERIPTIRAAGRAAACRPCRVITSNPAASTEDSVMAKPGKREARPPTRAAGFADIGQLISATALRTPDAVALDDGTRTLTYAAFEARANRTASALRAQGVGPGDRIAVLSEKRLEYLELAVAGARTGSILCALNWRFSLADLAHCVRLTKPALLFVSDRHAAALADLDLAGITTIRFGDAYEALPTPSPAEAAPSIVDPEDGFIILHERHHRRLESRAHQPSRRGRPAAARTHRLCSGAGRQLRCLGATVSHGGARARATHPGARRHCPCGRRRGHRSHRAPRRDGASMVARAAPRG